MMEKMEKLFATLKRDDEIGHICAATIVIATLILISTIARL